MYSGPKDKCIEGTGLRRFLAAFLTVVIAAAQCVMLWPAFAEESYGETAGETLSVRVQYFGERGDMIREKARFTRSDLESMGAGQYYYSNVTSAGTVMSMAAYGPEVLTIIESAGIDPGSILNITFRTTDGYTRNFTVDRHLAPGRLYYPNLSAAYQRGDSQDRLMPLEGALEGACEVPAILALEFGSSKEPGMPAEALTMSSKRSYRFCMGQTPLTEGQWSRPGENGDVSSLDSVYNIYGIDVTLAGSPVKGIGIDPVGSGLKVGSVTRLTIRVEGDDLFAEDYGKALGKLRWTSSDTRIATVDQEGNVTIRKAGRVTITVTAGNGMTASVTINGTGKAKRSDQAEATKQKQDRASKEPSAESSDPTRKTQGTEKRGSSAEGGTQTRSSQTDRTTETRPERPSETVLLREISLGDKVTETRPEGARENLDQQALEEDSAALEEQKPYGAGTVAGAAATAIAACGAGGAIRFRRFREILKGWKR